MLQIEITYEKRPEYTATMLAEVNYFWTRCLAYSTIPFFWAHRFFLFCRLYERVWFRREKAIEIFKLCFINSFLLFFSGLLFESFLSITWPEEEAPWRTCTRKNVIYPLFLSAPFRIMPFAYRATYVTRVETNSSTFCHVSHPNEEIFAYQLPFLSFSSRRRKFLSDKRSSEIFIYHMFKNLNIIS